ncbi:hypothetical protein [uncultured Zobellia sp.]|uniref:hypothetical protein n=1 Tax=uncultured Zobellia sp. TaxID=255433 RepID=UPI0025967FD6|nr:hypothetical protein [uncultured Zobellia sp.]
MKALIKSTVFFAVLVIMLILASCGKDDGPEMKDKDIAEQIQETEKSKEEPDPEPEVTAEGSNSLLENLVVKGGEKIEGDLPEPNASIEFNVSTVGGSAFVERGLSIDISSNSDFSGAYVKLKVEDALVSESYYNIGLEENRSTAKMAKLLNSKVKDKSAKYTYYNLNIGFTEEIKVGVEFCYLISVYDINGNISEPQEICTLLKGWGGYSEFEGEWHYAKTETYFPNGENSTLAQEEAKCYNYVYTCAGGTSFNYGNCTIKDESFDFRPDGTYTHTYLSNREELDLEASDMQCQAVYKGGDFNFIISGKWSYDETNHELIVAETNHYSNHYETGVFEEILPIEEAEIYTLGPITSSGDGFVVGFDLQLLGEDLNGDGNVNNDDIISWSYYQKQ